MSKSDINETLKEYIRKKSSPQALSHAILGGEGFMANEPSPLDYINASHQGIQKQALMSLAEAMKIPMKNLAALLNLSSKTLSRKKKTDRLDSLSSSLSIEIANTYAKGLSVFEDPEKLDRWLNKENRVLAGNKPFDLLRTPTGIKLVNQVLGRIEEGVYS